jgi:hypothetical protein
LGDEVRVVWAILAGIVGIVIGYVAAVFLSYAIMGALGVSDFEGMRAMASAFTFGPLGALLGLGAGIWLALRLTRRLA